MGGQMMQNLPTRLPLPCTIACKSRTPHYHTTLRKVGVAGWGNWIVWIIVAESKGSRHVNVSPGYPCKPWRHALYNALQIYHVIASSADLNTNYLHKMQHHQVVLLLVTAIDYGTHNFGHVKGCHRCFILSLSLCNQSVG